MRYEHAQMPQRTVRQHRGMAIVMRNHTQSRKQQQHITDDAATKPNAQQLTGSGVKSTSIVEQHKNFNWIWTKVKNRIVEL